MRQNRFRVVALLSEIATEARRKAAAGAPDHRYVEVDSPTGYPCRHCLRWASPGQRVVIFPFASIAPGRPYCATGPIFVHADDCERYSATDEYPADLRSHRVIRAYDAGENMIDAIVVGDNEPEAVIEKLLREPGTAFLQVHSVTRGCYTFRIERA
jgi:hypothetical protein